MKEELQSLVALEVADRMLAEVASVDDARRLVSMAEMARVYARQSRLGTSAVNHATVIKIRAERKLADIVDEGQRRGEIEEPGGERGNQFTGGIVRSPDNGSTPLPDLGIDRQRLAEARVLRDSYTEAELAERLADSNANDEVLSRQRLLQEARSENARYKGGTGRADGCGGMGGARPGLQRVPGSGRNRASPGMAHATTGGME